MWTFWWLLSFLVLLAGCRHAPAAANEGMGARGHGVRLPTTREGGPPKLLSQVGAFKDLRALVPAEGLTPYDINVSFWSDGAQKRRWIGLPAGGRIRYASEGEWKFPPGTVFVKNFVLPPEAHAPGHPSGVIETRVLVCDRDGVVHGASYKWRGDGSDADLVTEPITLALPDSKTSTRSWYFPGTADCQVCHTQAAGGVLGVKARQLNRPLGRTGENQLVAWNRRGMFSNERGEIDPAHVSALKEAGDTSASIEDRARSFLDVNCSNCHRPGGVAGNFDARYDTPLERQNLIGGPVLIDLGIDRARVISPHDVWRSIALLRLETSDQTRMPPLAHQTVDLEAAGVLRAWIESLPGAEVLAPPTIEPKGGAYRGTLRVVLKNSDPAAQIRYTLDGSAPGKTSAIYSGPIELKDPTTLRARAYKEGATRSIIVQETFIMND
jgi:uncharacterized repeat protein (TIGR03806 family)